ncbi:MAG: hypothetical protein U1E84_00515 [Rhodoferax sp.]
MQQLTWKQQRQEQKLQQRGQKQQRQEPMRQMREQQQEPVREQQREPVREQELLLSYRKQPEQQQRSRLPKRETCSFLETKVS